MHTYIYLYIYVLHTLPVYKWQNAYISIYMFYTHYLQRVCRDSSDSLPRSRCSHTRTSVKLAYPTATIIFWSQHKNPFCQNGFVPKYTSDLPFEILLCLNILVTWIETLLCLKETLLCLKETLLCLKETLLCLKETLLCLNILVTWIETLLCLNILWGGLGK